MLNTRKAPGKATLDLRSIQYAISCGVIVVQPLFSLTGSAVKLLFICNVVELDDGSMLTPILLPFSWIKSSMLWVVVIVGMFAFPGKLCNLN